MSVISTIVPAIDANIQHMDVKLDSGQSVTVRQWVSTSYSQNNATFNMPPPSQSVFIDRCFIKRTPVTITVSGTTSGSAMFQGGYDALRAYPIASITNSDQLTLNNQTFVMQTSEMVPYLSRYWKESAFSSFPSKHDNYQVYADGVGGINNPLGQYFNSLDNQNLPRGAFPMLITTNTTSSGVMSGDVYEPIWIPVLHREFGMGPGFTNIRTCDLVSNYNANLSRIFSHALSSATISSVSVTLGQPSIYQVYTSPQVGYVPRSMSYTTEDLNRFITPMATLASNASVTVASTNMQLNAIPKWIMVFVRESNAQLTYAHTDTACRIDNVSINFNNVSGILSACGSHDLFKLSKSNGLQDNWVQWYGITSNLATKVGTTGSFMKLMFGKDITLQAGEYPGKIGAYNLSLNVTVTNVNQSASIVAPNLYVITSVPQKVIIDEGGNVQSVLGISGEDGTYMPFTSISEHYGGSFGDVMRKIVSIGKPIVKFLRDNKVISTISSQIPHPVAQSISNAAKQLGFGENEGGKAMSRAELMKRVRAYK